MISKSFKTLGDGIKKLSLNRILAIVTITMAIAVIFVIFVVAVPSRPIYMISFGHIADVSKRTNFTSLPQISTSGNNVYLVWQANTANNSDIYFKHVSSSLIVQYNKD